MYARARPAPLHPTQTFPSPVKDTRREDPCVRVGVAQRTLMTRYTEGMCGRSICEIVIAVACATCMVGFTLVYLIIYAIQRWRLVQATRLVVTRSHHPAHLHNAVFVVVTNSPVGSFVLSINMDPLRARANPVDRSVVLSVKRVRTIMSGAGIAFTLRRGSNSAMHMKLLLGYDLETAAVTASGFWWSHSLKRLQVSYGEATGRALAVQRNVGTDRMMRTNDILARAAVMSPVVTSASTSTTQCISPA